MNIIQWLNENQGILAAIGIIVAIYLAVWAYNKKQQAMKLQNSQKFIEVNGNSASLGHMHISNNSMLQNIGIRGRSRKRRMRSLSSTKQVELASRGEALSLELFQFAGDRQNEEPHFKISQNSELTDKGRSEIWNEEIRKQEKYMKETQSLYNINFSGRVAEFFDEVQEIGFEVDNMAIQLNGHLAGPSPIQDIARQISVLSGRIKRIETSDSKRLGWFHIFHK